MSVLHCEVQLDNPKTIYQPGDRLTGCLILTLEVRLLLKAAGIKYTGFAEVKWETFLPPKKSKKSKNKSKQAQELAENAATQEQRLEVYTNREDFLSTVNYFMGSENATARIVERGTYTYPFAVTLPQSCPSSFESNNSHIRYLIEVFVDHKNISEVWYKQQLHVLKPLDLRHSTLVAAQSCNVHVEEIVLWKPFKKTIEMSLNIQQVGFVPGEAISAYVTIHNPANRNLNELAFELQQICCITASHGRNKTKTRYFSTTMAKAVHNFCGSQETMIQHLQVLFVPQTVPNTDPSDCRCLQISYELSVHLSAANEKRSLEAKLPITVGTVSLQCLEETQQQPQVLAPQSLDNSGASVKANFNNMSSSGPGKSIFAAATAPDPETLDWNMPMTPMPSSCFRDAEYLPKTKFDDKPKKSHQKRSQEKYLNQTNFKPKYLYFNMDDVTLAQNTTVTASSLAPIPERKTINSEKI